MLDGIESTNAFASTLGVCKIRHGVEIGWFAVIAASRNVHFMTSDRSSVHAGKKRIKLYQERSTA